MAYIDDIVIATETIEDHIMRIKEVFECLREAGFKMRAEKCDFIRTETKYPGRLVSTDGIKPDPEPVAKIQEWIPPRNKEDLQSFLGFANYYRDSVPFHAAKVQPIQELLKKNQQFYWEEKHQEAFDSVKQALSDATTLAAPNEQGRFVLDTDASTVAIAGILHQKQEIPESPVPTHSDSLDDASRRAPRYQLRANTAPRYRCGTRGSRDCSCVQLVTMEPPNLRLARGAAIPTRELTLAQAPNHPQHEILTVRAEQQKPKAPPIIRHIILTSRKLIPALSLNSYHL